MSENEALRMALIEIDLLRKREAESLRDTRASFRVLDGLMAAQNTEQAIERLLSVVLEEFAASRVMILQASADGARLCCVAQSGGAPPLPAGFNTDPTMLARPRRMVDLSRFGPDLRAAGYGSALIAPLPIDGKISTGLVVLFPTMDTQSSRDLDRLTHMAQVAVQPFKTLLLSQRNAELVALIEGHIVDPVIDGLDSSFQAVNRAYGRLTEGQLLAVDLLNALLTACAETIEATITKVLSEISRLCHADRSSVIEVMDDDTLTCAYEWTAPGLPPRFDALNGVSVHHLDPWLPQLLQGQEVLVQGADNAASAMRTDLHLLAVDVKSLIVTPMLANGRLHGILVNEMTQAPRSFLRGEIFLLRSVANAICATTRQHRTEQRNLEAKAALNLERNRLQATLAALPDLVVELDDEGRFVDHYSRQNSDLNRIAGALMGRTLTDALEPQLAAQALEMLAEVKGRGRSSGRTFRYDIGKGDLRWIRASATRREGEGPNPRPGYLFVLRDITRETEQGREISLLGEVAKRASNLIIVTDTNRRITWVNAAFERVTGWSRDEVLGHSPAKFLQSSKTDPAAIQKMRDALEMGQAVHVEVVNKTRTGKAYWVDIDIQPMLDEHGAHTGFMAIETLITERKQQEAALARAAQDAQEAQERLVVAVDSLEDGFVLFDRLGRLVICNDRYRQFADDSEGVIRPGITHDEILERGLRLGHFAEAIGREQEWLAERQAARRESEVSLELRLTSGRWIRVSDKSTPDGGRVGLRIDITALKEAEASALSDRAAAMDASHDGMAITDAKGNLLYANASFNTIIGIPTNGSAIRSHWTTLLDDRAAREIADNGMSRLTGKGGNWRGEVTITRPDSSLAEVELSLTRRKDGALVWVVRDLAERHRAEMESNHLRETLQIAQRREVIGQLAAGLAHDFNNLLAAISGSATLILDDDGPLAWDRARDHAERILKSAERAEGTVRKLLAIGARPQPRESRNLNSIVREASDLLRPGLGRSIRLDLELSRDPFLTQLEPTDILQIVLNLGINARDAMLNDPRPDVEKRILLELREATASDLIEGPALSLMSLQIGTITPHRRYACLTVADTGPGIDAETAQHIFTPYFSTKGEKGSGLGLPIVAGVIKAAQGVILFSSEPGQGTTAKVLLPVTDAVSDGNQTLPLTLPPGEFQESKIDRTRFDRALQGTTVLIVDDDEAVLSVVAAMLERAGAEVAPTSDALSALEVLAEDPDAFDLVITDFDMGSTTGADLARSIHAKAPALPVILITALPDWRQRDTKSGTEPAFFAVLGKPLSTQALVDTAIAALNSR